MRICVLGRNLCMLCWIGTVDVVWEFCLFSRNRRCCVGIGNFVCWVGSVDVVWNRNMLMRSL